MIQVQYMKPFFTKVTGGKVKFVFAYDHFSIMKEDEVYKFVPIEGKEIVVNLNTMQVENLSEVFVFQRGNRFIRLPLYQLLLVSNVHDHLMPLLDSAASNLPKQSTQSEDFDKETLEVIHFLESENLSRLIDNALLERDEAAFYNLLLKQQKLNGEYLH